MGSFGEKLRKQREQRGIAIEAISSTTKISTRMLRALEEENFSQLPGGVFNKGFVRAYARHVGIDEEEAISDYLEALRESQIASQKIAPDFRAPARRPLAAPGSAPISSVDEENHRDHVASQDQDRAHHDLHDSEALLHIEEQESNLDDSEFAEDPLGKDPSDKVRSSKDSPSDDRSRKVRQTKDRQTKDRSSEDRQSKDQDDSDESTAAPFDPAVFAAAQPERAPFVHIPWGALAAALIIIFTVVALWNLHRHSRLEASVSERSGHQTSGPAVVGQPSASAPQAPANIASIRAASPSQKQPSVTVPRIPVAKSSAVAKAPVATAQSPTTNPTSSPTSSANTLTSTQKSPVNSTSPQSFTLLIRADKTSWVSITADGNPVATETLIAPAATSVRAHALVVVKTGNAAGVSFLLNGKEIPAQGNDGEVRTYTFDSSGMKVGASSTPAYTTAQ